MPCRIFALPTTYTALTAAAGGGHSAPDPAFTTKGFKTWVKALQAFRKHESTVAHRHAVASLKEFLEKKHVDQQIDEEVTRRLAAEKAIIDQNRGAVGRLLSITRFLGRLCLPFRGHEESQFSQNRGMFVEFARYLSLHGDEILRRHLELAPKNAQCFGPRIQNQMIALFGEAIKDEIIKRVRKAQFFVPMMDETQDAAHCDQVIVMLRYVHSQGRKENIEERMVALVSAKGKTGEAMETLLLETLKNLGLSLDCIIGQCYDGGANLSGCFNGVQARILARNSLALFVHCHAHSLNRALVNSVNHRDVPQARNFFSILEHLIVFVGRSSHRQGLFLEFQADLITQERAKDDDDEGTDHEDELVDSDDDENPDLGAKDEPQALGRKDEGIKKVGMATTSRARPKRPGRSMSDTRWSSRAASISKYSDPRIFEAAYRTIKNVSETSTDAEAKSTALGLLATTRSPIFIVLLIAFRDILLAVNKVSLYLQSKTIDIAAALEKITSLKRELQEYRVSSTYWDKCIKEAGNLAERVGVDLGEAFKEQDETSRDRKRPRRFDDRPGTSASLTTQDSTRVRHFYPALDRMISELGKRFPGDLGDFAYLQPSHFHKQGAEAAIKRLGERYQKFVLGNAVSEWRLFRHTSGLAGKNLAEVCEAVPEHYIGLKELYRIFLTLPITTASLERGFSKLKIVENRLRSTQTQERLESLLLLAVEKDISSSIDVSDLVSRFADQSDRRLKLK